MVTEQAQLNLKIIETMWRYIQEPASRDLDAYESLLHEEHVWTSDTVRYDPDTLSYTTGGERLALKGPRFARVLMEMYIVAFPDLKFDEVSTIAQDDSVVSRWHATGTHAGEFLRIGPTGNPGNVRGCSWYILRDGKILETHTFWDVSVLLRQMGWEGWLGPLRLPVPAGFRARGQSGPVDRLALEVQEIQMRLGVLAEESGKTFHPSGASDAESIPTATRATEQQFRALAEQWRRETGMLSSISKMAMHPAYQRIIGMGARAISPILLDLQKRPDHWFWALNAITGENPVPQESIGNLRQMAEAWIGWGKSRGYIS